MPKRKSNDQQLELEDQVELLAMGRSEAKRRKAISRAIQLSKERGEPLGFIPYGQRVSKDGRRLEVDPREAATLAFIVERRKLHDTYEQIVEQCTLKGFRNRRGKKFSVTSIVNICRRELPDLHLPGARRRKKSPKPKEAA